MPPLTPKRTRLSIKQKIKIIEDSKKVGFDKKKTMETYGISRTGLITLLKNQTQILKAADSGSINENVKSIKKSPLEQLECKLYDWLTTRLGAAINGPLLKGQALIFYKEIYGNKPNPPQFVASNGWMENFKLRYDIKFKKRIGKRIS